GPNGADLAEIGREPRTGAVDAMARRAPPLAIEERLAASRIAARDGDRTTASGCRRRRPAAQERDDRSRLRLRKAARRHRRAGNSRLNDADDLGVRRRAAELTALKLDAGDHVAVRSVTAGAARLVEPRAV